MSETKAKLDQEIENFQKDYAAFTEKGNKTAGTRARKALNELGKLTKELRKEIQESKNNAE